jgi:hypothetical protein
MQPGEVAQLTCISMEFPSIDIMKITGHKKQSNFMLYIKQSKEETANRIIREFRVTKPLKRVTD